MKTREQLRAAWLQLRHWKRSRLAAAVAAAAVAAAVVVWVNGMMTEPAIPWWSFIILATGSLLAGLVFGSYLGAPIGAEATVCDTRWPLLGLTGLVIATSTGQQDLAADPFSGASPTLVAGVIQPALALLSLALLGWALLERLELERAAVSSSDRDASGGEVCTTCRPLFAVKPGPSNARNT